MTPPSFIIETTRKKYVVPDNNGDIVWICVEYVKLDSRGVKVPNAKVGPYSRRAVEGWSMTKTIRRLVSVIVVASAESTRGPPVGAVVVPASAIATRSERRRMYREPIWLDVKLRSEQSGEKMRNRNAGCQRNRGREKLAVVDSKALNDMPGAVRMHLYSRKCGCMESD